MLGLGRHLEEVITAKWSVRCDCGIQYSASFNNSDSSSAGSDELMSGPDAVAKMSNFGVSGSFSSDYYKYMESKKNRHSFSAGT